MSDTSPTPPQDKKSTSQVISDSFEELISTLLAFFKAPRALWGINIPYVLEGLTYFGVLTILGKYCSENCGLNDLHAGWVYGGVTGGITFAMLLFGGFADKIGVRTSLVISLVIMAVGRGIVALSDTLPLANGPLSPQLFVMCGGLLLMVAAYGLYQPAAYAGVKRYTTPQTAAMGYAVVYGLMNLGAFVSGAISPLTRVHFETSLPPNGLAAVFWLYGLLTLTGALVTFFILSKKTDQAAVDRVARETEELKKAAEEKAEEKEGTAKEKPEEKKSAGEDEEINNTSFLIFLFMTIVSFAFFVTYKAGCFDVEPYLMSTTLFGSTWDFDFWSTGGITITVVFAIVATFDYILRRPDHPFRDVRFVFFIFILIPVQTLFAHNWLTLPYYLDRAFAGTAVSDYFELFSNLNPILIFVLAPIVAGLTARANIYRMMILGTLVMAAPTFLLAIGPNIYIFLAYILIMSLGEAMWQPRFLQWIAEIAPEGKTGAYMGIGQLPWFLTKVVTSFYSGWFVAQYITKPEILEDGTKVVTATETGEMWFYYALIAMITPVALILAKGWMSKGMKEKAS